MNVQNVVLGKITILFQNNTNTISIHPGYFISLLILGKNFSLCTECTITNKGQKALQHQLQTNSFPTIVAESGGSEGSDR